MLQKDGKSVDMASNILDGDFVIGVWASASRQKIRTLTNGSQSYTGDWVQVSRLGMPLTNEAVIPVGQKDKWNATTPYNSNDLAFASYFMNPELALYMDDAQFGAAVPSLNALRIQKKSLGSFNFGNGQKGLFGLKGSPALAGTALDDAIFGTILLPDSASPRAVDILPIFYTGVPNLRPYQLATGKGGNPLAEGKPFHQQLFCQRLATCFVSIWQYQLHRATIRNSVPWASSMRQYLGLPTPPTPPTPTCNGYQTRMASPMDAA